MSQTFAVNATLCLRQLHASILMMPTTLPPDLIKAIVDDLALQKDTTTLEACTLQAL